MSLTVSITKYNDCLHLQSFVGDKPFHAELFESEECLGNSLDKAFANVQKLFGDYTPLKKNGASFIASTELNEQSVKEMAGTLKTYFVKLNTAFPGQFADAVSELSDVNLLSKSGE